MQTKKPIESKTIWFNALAMVGIILTDLLATTEFRELLNNNVIYIMLAGAFANFCLRFATDKPIRKEPTEKDRLDMLDPEKQADDTYGIETVKEIV